MNIIYIYIYRNNHETHFPTDMSQNALLEELPQSLRSEVMTLIYQQNNLGVIAFFQGKHPEFIHNILPLLKPLTFEKDDIIYRDGDWADESIIYIIFIVYFILSGSVKMINPEHLIYRNYGGGSYFGEVSILKQIVYLHNSK